MDFDLADALDDKNDGKDARRPDIRPDEGMFTSPLCAAAPQAQREVLPGTGSPSKQQGGEEQKCCLAHGCCLHQCALGECSVSQAAQPLPPGQKEPLPLPSLAERGSA